jgi:hypothetical protein
LFECFAVAVPSLLVYLFSFFLRGLLLLLFEGFLCEKQRGKKEEEVEERKELCGVKKEAGGGR